MLMENVLSRKGMTDLTWIGPSHMSARGSLSYNAYRVPYCTVASVRPGELCHVYNL